jgi:hypothetical protein
MAGGVHGVDHRWPDRDTVNLRGPLARNVLLALVLFVVTLTVHGFSPVSNVGGDSYWSTFTARSLMLHGDLDISEYRHLIADDAPHVLRRDVDGEERLYNTFPYGSSVIAIPLMVVADAWLHVAKGSDIDAYLNATLFPEPLERFAGSMFTAATTVLVFLLVLARRGARHWVLAGLAAVIFAFCTTAWSTVSRALWVHGPSLFLLTGALLLVVIAPSRPRLTLGVLGVVLAMSYVVRPTNAVPVIVLSALVAWRHRRAAPFLVAGGLLVAVPFGILNEASYGAILPPYYRASRLGEDAKILTALIGNVISPARGLVIYSPVLLLGVVGAVMVVRRWQRTRTIDGLDVSCMVVVAVHWVVISSYYHWWGGWSYGPRLFTEATPFLIALAVEPLAAVGRDLNTQHRSRSLVAAAAIGLAMMWSAFVHWRGATDVDTIRWNAQPTNVDLDEGRLWDWNDVQIFR